METLLTFTNQAHGMLVDVYKSTNVYKRSKKIPKQQCCSNMVALAVLQDTATAAPCHPKGII